VAKCQKEIFDTLLSKMWKFFNRMSHVVELVNFYTAKLLNSYIAKLANPYTAKSRFLKLVLKYYYMVVVFTDNKKFYYSIEPTIPIKTKMVVDYDYLQNNLEGCELIIFDAEKRSNGAMSFLKETELIGGKMPKTLVFVEKNNDRWLADWSGATKTISKNANSAEILNTVKELL
jgi:hypothetical protein